MKRRLKIVALCSAVVVLGALNIPTQTNDFKPEKKSTPNGIFEWVEDNQAAMTPAWYQYFNLQNSQQSISSGKAKLAFVPKGEQAEDLKIFELVNTSTQTLALPIQDGSLMMIQEAKNNKGEWQPIEFWQLDWGFGSHLEDLKLQPQQSVLFTAPKFSGNFATEVRFKLKISAQEIYYSETFKAKIDVGHFQITKSNQQKKISYLEQ